MGAIHCFIVPSSNNKIRNLCLGNEENQRYINEFKVERVAVEPALEKLGVKVTVEDGKAKVTKA